MRAMLFLRRAPHVQARRRRGLPERLVRFVDAEGRQKREWTDFERFDRIRPDFLSWNVNDLPHKIPFLMKELHGSPIMAWTVRTAEQREAARKWADQIVFEGDARP